MRDDALLALRLWRDADRASPWRARVTDLRDGAVETFVDVPALLRYLSEAFGADGAPASALEAGTPEPATSVGDAIDDGT